jgi:hypothetical protein
MPEMMPPRHVGLRRSKKCCAEVVTVAGTTGAAAMPDDRVKPVGGPDTVETSDVSPVGGLGEMLGNKPELAPRQTGTNRRWRWSPDTDDPVALKCCIIAVAQDALTAQAEIARLKIPVGSLSAGRVRF